jgi:uncharacterized OB-fold protein
MEKPMPLAPAPVSQPFWEGCDRETLVYQRCRGCGHAQHYPRTLCVACAGQELEWSVSAGRGEVYSHTTVMRAPNDAFKADVPYVIAVIDLDEGFRVVTNILSPPDDVRIGSRATACFETRGGRRLLQFKLD